MTTRKLGVYFALVGLLITGLIALNSIINEPKSTTYYTIGNSLYGLTFKELLSEKGIEYFPHEESSTGEMLYSFFRKDIQIVKELSQKSQKLTDNSEGYNFNTECTLNQVKSYLEDRNIIYFIDRSGKLGSNYTVWTSTLDAKEHNVGGKTLGTEYTCVNS